MQPSLAGRCIVLALDIFVQHVSAVPSKTYNFLLQPLANVAHQVRVALRPQFLGVKKIRFNALARSFESVLFNRFGIQRRQFTMPVNWDSRFSRFHLRTFLQSMPGARSLFRSA
jgi:hypothetical protein